MTCNLCSSSMSTSFSWCSRVTTVIFHCYTDLWNTVCSPGITMKVRMFYFLRLVPGSPFVDYFFIGCQKAYMVRKGERILSCVNFVLLCSFSLLLSHLDTVSKIVIIPFWIMELRDNLKYALFEFYYQINFISMLHVSANVSQ